MGWKFRYEGGYAIQQAGSNMIELFDEPGKLLLRAWSRVR